MPEDKLPTNPNDPERDADGFDDEDDFEFEDNDLEWNPEWGDTSVTDYPEEEHLFDEDSYYFDYSGNPRGNARLRRKLAELYQIPESRISLGVIRVFRLIFDPRISRRLKHVVYLENWGIGDVGVYVLTSKGNLPTDIRKLILTRNRITDKGLCALALASRSRKCFFTLERLDLGSNFITSEGLRHFLRLAYMPDLRFLFLQQNFLDNSALDHLLKYLDRFPKLEMISVDRNNLDPDKVEDFRGQSDLIVMFRSPRQNSLSIQSRRQKEYEEAKSNPVFLDDPTQTTQFTPVESPPPPSPPDETTSPSDSESSDESLPESSEDITSYEEKHRRLESELRDLGLIESDLDEGEETDESDSDLDIEFDDDEGPEDLEDWDEEDPDDFDDPDGPTQPFRGA